MGWVILGLLAFWLLSKVWFYVSMWAWRRSLKDPKARLEAELMWRSFRKK